MKYTWLGWLDYEYVWECNNLMVLLPHQSEWAFSSLLLITLPAQSWFTYYTSNSFENRFIVAATHLTTDYIYLRDFFNFSEKPILNSFLDLHLVTHRDSASWKVFGEVDKEWGNGQGPESEAIKRLKQTIYDNYHPKKLPIDLLVESTFYPIDSRVAFPKESVNTSDIVYHNETLKDLKKMPQKEIFKLEAELKGEEINRFQRFERVRSIYQASIPTVKMFFPEPGVASPSKTHTDISFIHILQYQFWLWFVFCFIIVFFLISFLSTVRWCNVRTQPRRETRGVSRSKCGDLITASVPVTWAASIIVSETTDALDYYDGFGTGELVVGVRAFQWGWEYYYPRNIDLSYNVKPSYSTFIGNSVKHNVTSDSTLNKANVWRYYQNRVSDEVVSPAHLLLLPLDNTKLLNFTNFDDIGASHVKNETAFKRVRTNSKVYNTNLVHTPSNLSSKYSLINKIQSNEGVFSQSPVYGISRQHTLTSAAATSSASASYLDSRSVKQLLESNYNYYNTQAHLDVTSKPSPLVYDANLPNANDEVNLLSDVSTGKTLEQGFKTNPNVIGTLNHNSEKKQLSYPVRKIMNNKVLLKNSNTSNLNFQELNPIVDSKVFNDSTLNTQPKLDFDKEGNRLLKNEGSVRHYEKLSATSNKFNLSSDYNNVVKSFNDNITYTGSGSLVDYFYKVQANWVNKDNVTRLAGNRLFLAKNNFPIKTNTPLKPDALFDSFKQYSTTVKSVVRNEENVLTLKVKADKSKNLNISKLLIGERGANMPFIASTHWTAFWANSHIDTRLNNLIQNSKLSNYSYLPEFVAYADYDFRNVAALELLEDAFWETSYSGYDHYDYLTIKEQLKKSPYIGLKEEDTLNENKNALYNTVVSIAFEKFPSLTPVLEDKSVLGSFYTNSVQSDDLITPSTLLNKNDFIDYGIGLNLYDIDDSYASFKGFSDLTRSKFGTVLPLFTPYQLPLSYTSVLNMFRDDYDDFAPHVDSSDSKLTNLVKDASGTTNEFNSFSASTGRFSDALSLRKTAQNSIATYAAYQKVFQPRFDAGRNLANFNFFSDLSAKQPFMTDGRTAYESLLSKNKESFYNTTFYNPSTLKLGNFIPNTTNTYFFELPFLNGVQNEATRYWWFDGYARFVRREVQPSSLSRNSLLGVPYSRKHFDYTPNGSDLFQNREIYFSRLSRARKNYVNQWIYAPYLTLRSGEWVSNKLIWDELTTLDSNNKYSTGSVKKVLSTLEKGKNALMFHNNTSSTFVGTNSMNNLYIRSIWRPSGGVQSYFYNVSTLVDILSRREFLYRQYFQSNSSLIHLPKILTATPNNPLLKELKSSYSFLDPITYTTEYSRDFYYHSLNFFKFLVFRDTLLNLAQTTDYLPINWSLLTEYLFFYLLDTSKSKTNNNELYKNQFRPLKKGINNMLRLHATGAIAMPIELRLQILASSRDVIHSWAIPSAGIKIDCIPGYTSHRIMIFLVAGIYWGQCMEICGRYHHWMPIVAYFMKRDLFFLWCTHFIFKSSTPSYGIMNDRQYADYLQFVSYDKASWLNEVAQQEL